MMVLNIINDIDWQVVYNCGQKIMALSMWENDELPPEAVDKLLKNLGYDFEVVEILTPVDIEWYDSTFGTDVVAGEEDRWPERIEDIVFKS